MQTVIMLGAVGVIAWIAYTLVSHYGEASGTPRERLWAAFKGSATIILAKVTTAVGAILAALPAIGDALNLPELKAAMSALMTPQAMSVAVLVLGLLTIWARNRTLDK